MDRARARRKREGLGKVGDKGGGEERGRREWKGGEEWSRGNYYSDMTAEW